MTIAFNAKWLFENDVPRWIFKRWRALMSLVSDNVKTRLFQGDFNILFRQTYHLSDCWIGRTALAPKSGIRLGDAKSFFLFGKYQVREAEQFRGRSTFTNMCVCSPIILETVRQWDSETVRQWDSETVRRNLFLPVGRIAEVKHKKPLPRKKWRLIEV